MPRGWSRQGIPLNAWPAVDRIAWADACGPQNTLLARSNASGWRKSTREAFIRYYGMWLAWLSDQGLLNPATRPSERMTYARCIAYLQERQRQGNNARTLHNHLIGLHAMMLALEPTCDWTWMKQVASVVKMAVESTEKHANLPSIRELFELGLALMRYGETADRSMRRRAVMFRNGLAIALLAARPLMRRDNICRIRIGQHMIREGDHYRLRFGADEMKGRRARGGPVPEMLTRPIDRYIDHYRPLLLDGRTDDERALWISALGRPIYPHAFSNEIGNVTEAALGRRVTMHEFRHAAASSIAKEDPEHVGIAATVNGHATYRTTERYYIIAEEHAAFVRYHKALDRLAVEL